MARQRTRHVTLVFGDIDKPHNVSAVLRTAECMGIQDVHFIENRNAYQVNPAIVHGAAKWLTLHRHNQASGTENVDRAFGQLRREGYVIYATALHREALDISAVDLTQKAAVVFGTEIEGISPYVADHADTCIKIPMWGFTESFNLSVSAAIILNTFFTKFTTQWLLTNDERAEVIAAWYQKVVKASDKILARVS